MFDRNMFSRAGQYEGSDSLQAALAAEGYISRARKMSESHRARVDSFAKLFGDVCSGREDPFLLKEAFAPSHEYAVAELQLRYPGVLRLSETMSVTDFAGYLTVDVLDRMLYGYWSVDDVPNRVLVKEEPFRDFRDVKRFTINGGVEPFKKQGSAGIPPEERALTPGAPITFSPDLYQGMMSINWRAIVNDDLGIFNDLVQRLASSWNLTVWKAITELYVAATGPHTALYNSTFGNQITIANGAAHNNPPLELEGLIDADAVLMNKLSPDGQPMTLTGTKYLWYGPALAGKVAQIIATIQMDIASSETNTDGFPNRKSRVNPSYLTGGFTPVLDKYIPIVCTQTGVRNTMWGVTYDPKVQARPSLVFGMMRGFETPQIYQRVPNTQRPGGAVEPAMGDFLTMDTDYKAICVFGGTQVDGRSTVASTGAGS